MDIYKVAYIRGFFAVQLANGGKAGELAQNLVGKIAAEGIDSRGITEVIMVPVCVNLPGTELVAAEVLENLKKEFPQNARDIFNAKASLYMRIGAADRLLAEVAEYERVSGADQDSKGARLQAYLLEGFEKHQEEIKALVNELGQF